MTQKKIPNCIGVIMDGNRRWAKGKGQLALKGHEAGGETLKKVVKWSRDSGVNHIIFFTFSTENWNRAPEEVIYLLNLIGVFLKKELNEFHTEGGVLHFVGDLSRFSKELQETLKEAEEKTSKNKGRFCEQIKYFICLFVVIIIFIKTKTDL